MSERERVEINRVIYEVIDRMLLSHKPELNSIYARVFVKKPKGQVVFAADEIFVGYKEPQLTGIPFLDEGIKAQPRRMKFSYAFTPEHDPNGDVQRRFQDKSPCCNRTMREVSRVAGLAPRRFCRKCNREVF